MSSPKLYDPAATSRQTFEETDANLNLAASYRFRPNWSVAIEGLNIREFNSYTLHREINNGYYAGPSIHYGGRHFYATASLLRQLPWATHNVATVPGAVVGGYDIDNDDEVVGKHDFIPFALALDASGAVKGVEILEYREAYGGQVRNPQWLAQFLGKRPGQAFKLGHGVKNISGATLSCKHVTDGVRRLLATWEIVLKEVQPHAGA